MLPLALLAAAALAAAPAPPPSDPEALRRLAERDALRALAAAGAGDPAIEDVQDAAARVADRAVPEAASFARRARLSALLPRVAVEVRRDERSTRIVGLQTSGEVDYRNLSPGGAISVTATWDLGELVAARGELAAAQAEAERARRRAEAVRRATALHYERRRERLALLVDPPAGALERAEAELRVERLGAELDALTGGLLSGRAR